MGWLTGAIGAIIAGICLYKFLLSTLKGPTRTVQSAESKEQRSANPRARMGTKQDLLVTTAPSAKNVPTAKMSSTSKEGTARPQETRQVYATPKTAMPHPSLPQVMPPPAIEMPPPRSKSPPRLKPPTIGAPPRLGGGALRPPPSAASSLRVPPQKVLSNASMAPSGLMPPPKKSSKQVALEPGHSPLDWANLTSSPNHGLRGKDAPDQLIKITPSQLKLQNGRKGRDSWTVYQGKVYNITPYVPFHPGGKGEILRGAGKDSAKLFMEVHPWVNWDGMLAECMVGILVSENETHEANDLDEMD